MYFNIKCCEVPQTKKNVALYEVKYIIITICHYVGSAKKNL